MRSIATALMDCPAAPLTSWSEGEDGGSVGAGGHVADVATPSTTRRRPICPLHPLVMQLFVTPMHWVQPPIDQMLGGMVVFSPRTVWHPLLVEHWSDTLTWSPQHILQSQELPVPLLLTPLIVHSVGHSVPQQPLDPGAVPSSQTYPVTPLHKNDRMIRHLNVSNSD